MRYTISAIPHWVCGTERSNGVDERFIDLHTHSTESDGAMSPREVIRHAKEAGLSAVALSDHDTIGGVESAMDEGRKVGIEVVPAIELSAQSDTETHILGYYIDINSDFLNSKLADVRRIRDLRSLDIHKRLTNLGFDIDLDEVRSIAPGGIVGRAHFARVMATKGYVTSVKEAFDKWLSNGKPGYSTIQALSEEEGVRLIKNAGGLAFIAHLNQTKKDIPTLHSFLARLKDCGLDGIEGYYTEYTPEMDVAYRKLASDLSLIISGGSDFHWTMKPHIAIGRGLGNLHIPYSVLENIKNEYLKQKKA